MSVLSSDRTGSITNSGEILIGNDNPWYVQAQSGLTFVGRWCGTKYGLAIAYIYGKD
ncbi:MAG: hypothetical protein KME25_32705 [Symplocastrum torsivum CPER-KK1]|uniref:Uncharacterized protein n=1 Tax=Symplocastrum torsivum CPER-KK1 TaxID=450513 RepID=A0A951PRU3_9CYAN|nr:hypothetical protein [Symplocastrum torsivum CPER-KK1]